ncbi:cytochrome P450 CYP82D47-like [Tasmannia lanceolata]|uniref:cytochrome P450 CYP82D47-like n=1 Tax=Tasmannia lanceolata TaxID=3420 RepID=UPI004063539C
MDFDLQLETIAGLLAMLIFYNIWIAKTKTKKSKFKQAPEPAGGLPIIGHLHLLRGTKPTFRILADMADNSGPVFTIRLGMERAVFINTWELAKECFTTNDKVLASRPRSAAGKYMCYDFAMFGFAPYGPYWREVRKIAMLELLSNRKLEALKPVRTMEVDLCIKDLYGLWDQNPGLPVKVEMKQKFEDLTFNALVMMIAGKRYFGKSIGSDEGEARRFQHAIHSLFDLCGVFVLSDLLPLMKWIDIQGVKKAMKRTAESLDSIVVGWIEEHRWRRKSEDNSGHDFIDVMLSILENVQLPGYDTDTIIKATSLALILAGTDTTSVTLTWVLSLLLNNPRVLKKAQDELDIHVGKERQVDESDIKNLVYLQAIVKETMRLYPAAPLAVPHLAMEDCDVGGIHIPAGNRVLVNIWKLQRDPRVWSDPNEFQPERFLTSHKEVDARGQHYEFIPFGTGRRACPGTSFALHLMHLMLARLLQSFDLDTPLGMTVDMTESSGLTIPKATPLEVLLTPRLTSDLFD